MLEYWKILKKFPYCWEKIQPILCAYYMPNCENNTVYLPTQVKYNFIIEYLK